MINWCQLKVKVFHCHAVVPIYSYYWQALVFRHFWQAPLNFHTKIKSHWFKCQSSINVFEWCQTIGLWHHGRGLLLLKFRSKCIRKLLFKWFLIDMEVNSRRILTHTDTFIFWPLVHQTPMLIDLHIIIFDLKKLPWNQSPLPIAGSKTVSHGIQYPNYTMPTFMVISSLSNYMLLLLQEYVSVSIGNCPSTGVILGDTSTCPYPFQLLLCMWFCDTFLSNFSNLKL